MPNKVLLLSVAIVVLVIGLLYVVSSYSNSATSRPNQNTTSKTTFPYQVIVQPTDNLPQNGTCDAVFSMYELGPNGTFGALDGTVTRTVTIKNGSFVASLDFGINVRDAVSRWVDTSVRCAPASTEFVKLKPKAIIVAQ